MRRVGIAGRRGLSYENVVWRPRSSEGNERLVIVIWRIFVHVLMARNRWRVAVGTICVEESIGEYKEGVSVIVNILGADREVKKSMTYCCRKVVIWVRSCPLEHLWTMDEVQSQRTWFGCLRYQTHLTRLRAS